MAGSYWWCFWFFSTSSFCLPDLYWYNFMPAFILLPSFLLCSLFSPSLSISVPIPPYQIMPLVLIFYFYVIGVEALCFCKGVRSAGTWVTDSYRAAMWGLLIEPRSFGKIASGLIHWVISPAPSCNSWSLFVLLSYAPLLWSMTIYDVEKKLLVRKAFYNPLCCSLFFLST